LEKGQESVTAGRKFHAIVNAFAFSVFCQLLSELFTVALPFSLKNWSETRINLKASANDAAAETATVEIEFPESDPDEFKFVRVEGKWIPRWLAEGWGPAVIKARGFLEQALPSEIARDNFGPTFQFLGAIDLILDNGLAGLRGDETESLLVGLFDEADSIPSVGSCLMLLGYLIGGPPTTEPDFDLKTKQSLVGKDKTVVVYCYAGKELKWDNEALDYDVAKHVAYRLNNNTIKVIDPDLVYDWLANNDKWRKTAEIGKHFRVDYVVHIDVKDYSLFEPHAANLYRGRADIIVNVVKMDNDKRDGSVIYTTPVKSLYPTRSPVDSNVMSYADFKKHYLSALSDEIGRLFYVGDAGRDISEKPDEEQSGALIGNPFGESGEHERKTAGKLTPRKREARAVTNSDVITMVNNGVSDSLICHVVSVREGRFDTSPKGIDALKRSGVSDLVIEAMQNAGAENK